jgi:ribonuclease E
VQGEDTWNTISDYVNDVAPELAPRVSKYTGTGDLFHDLRVDEGLAKGLDRKVWLPSGGSLVIDRTEAMTVVDVNTGKFVGAGGNLEQTVTRNNLEAAEEIVRQLRLRDIGGIVVIDFIDMVLESNRDLVLRRLTECLGRDRTKHQVAEVTSLGLVQMTRKRVGEGLLEAFSETCPTCHGRGVLIHSEPVAIEHEHAPESDEAPNARRRNKRGGRKSDVVEPLELTPAASEEQRRAAANAIASIAQATLVGGDLDGHDEAAGANYGSRASDDLVDDLVEVPVEEGEPITGDALADAVADVVTVTSEPQTRPDTQPEPESAAAPEASAAPARRGRRRAASRPAGPPVPVG